MADDPIKIQLDRIEELVADLGEAVANLGVGLAQVKANQTRVLIKEEAIMADLTSLEAEVARNTEVDQSAVTLLQGLATQLEAVKTDPAKVQALANSLRSSSDALAAAVAANTSAA